MVNTENAERLHTTNSSHGGSVRNGNQRFSKKSVNRLVLFAMGLSLLSVFLVGCATTGSSSANADAQPTVELIQTAAINTAVPQAKNSNVALPIGNAGTWLPGQEDDTDPNDLQRVTQILVDPPFLPEFDQVVNGAPKVVQVRLEIEEKLVEIEPGGAKVWTMSFNGTVPGPIIVVHQNDYVELTLVNPAENSLVHNIDLHSATGALGGAQLTLVGPGEEATFRFKATKPGVFTYHCAPGGSMIPFHVVSGMNGAIMVLPREGLTDAQGNSIKFDKAYYIGEQDFYVPTDEDGNYKTYDSPIDSFGDVVEVMKTLTPSHVVFNGAVGALTGDNAMTAKVGEKVLFIHSQANRDTRPHLIGGQADLVWPGGSFSNLPDADFETWFVPGGSAGAMLYEFRQPGTYVYINHNLITGVLKGALAHVVVEGEWNDTLMTQLSEPGPIK